MTLPISPFWEPSVITNFDPFRKSRTDPSLSSYVCSYSSCFKFFLTKMFFGKDIFKHLASKSNTLSKVAKILRELLESYWVFCMLIITVPKPLPLAKDFIGWVAHWSAYMPLKLVPRQRHNWQLWAHHSMPSARSPLSYPSIRKTGLEGSNQLPWTSFIFIWGKPAFCGKPSWFCCTH